MNSGLTYWFKIIHRWVSLFVFLFLIYKVATGMFLQLRKPVDWIQPPSSKGEGHKKYAPETWISHDRILEATKSVPEAKVSSWKDILLLDARPKNAMVKVRTYDYYEVQVDLVTGEVLSHNQRWNDIIGAWHSGSALGGFGLVLFLVLSILAFVLTVTGTYLAFTTTVQKIKDAAERRKARAIAAEQGIELPDEDKPFSLVRWCLDYHYYFSILIAVPYLVITFTGLLLTVRDLQGEYPGLKGSSGTLAKVVGSSNIPTLSYEEAVKVGQSVKDMEFKKVKHIWRIYTFPNEGIMSLRAKRHQGKRLQIDAATGEILFVDNEFTSDWLEDLHQGYFYEVTGKRKDKGWGSLDLSLDLFILVHVLFVFFWILGTIASLKLTILKPADE